MCHPLILGRKYAECQCFVPLRKEFIDCLLETCTSSLCHPYECVGYLCTCTRAWEGEELKVVRWEEGVCAGCWEGDVRPFSPQRIYHKRVLSPALHEMSAKYSTMTRTPSSLSQSRSGAANLPTHPQAGSRPPSQRSRGRSIPSPEDVRGVSRASGRSYASLADYGYSVRPPPAPAPRTQRGLPSATLSTSFAGAGAALSRSGSRLHDIREYEYEGDYDVRPPTRARAGLFGNVREAVDRSLSSGSTVSGQRR